MLVVHPFCPQGIEFQAVDMPSVFSLVGEHLVTSGLCPLQIKLPCLVQIFVQTQVLTLLE